MSDVIWAAMIAVGGSAITGFIAYRAAPAQTAVTIQTAKSQADVELVKVRGELDRLRGQYRENESPPPAPESLAADWQRCVFLQCSLRGRRRLAR